MKRVHPNLSLAPIAALVALAIGMIGCRSTSSGVGSTFLAPDRVPPPSTRALLPGQAQPYYQGDPISKVQSAPAQPATAVAADELDANSRSASGRTLAWAQPGSSPPPAASTPSSTAIATANEGSVAVPADGDPLRYSLPATKVPEGVPAVAATTSQPAYTPPQLQPVAQPQSGVQQASYNAPVASSPSTFANVSPTMPTQQIASPWRSPQIAAATPAQGAGPLALPPPPIAPAVQPQPTIPANTVAATLRAVASPPQPGDPMPRVRMPGYVDQPQYSTADGFRPRTSMQ